MAKPETPMKSTSHGGSDDDAAFAPDPGSQVPLMVTKAECRTESEQFPTDPDTMA